MQGNSELPSYPVHYVSYGHLKSADTPCRLRKGSQQISLLKDVCMSLLKRISSLRLSNEKFSLAYVNLVMCK